MPRSARGAQRLTGPKARTFSCGRGPRTTGPSRAIRSLVVFDRRAGADELAVSQHAVEAGDAGPELVLAHPRPREGGPLARVGPLPGVGGDRGRGVRRALEHVVLAGGPALLNLADLLADGDEGVTEAVQLVQRLALGGLHHERPDRKSGV